MLSIAASLLGLLALAAGADGPGRLAIIRSAPDVELVDAGGKALSLRGYRGKAVLVSFIFTTCNGSCPATTHRLAKIQEALSRRPDLRDRVEILSITLDPERDTPEVLRRYRDLYEVNSRNWSFATGPVPQVRQTLAAWNMWARPAANGQLDHPSRVYLVDPRQRIREIYNLDFLRVPWVIEDLESLLHE